MHKCLRCAVEFVPRDLNPAHLLRNPPRFCSRSCAQPNRKATVLLRCVVCQKEFERKRYMADWSKDRGPFCGFGCYGTWQVQNTVGPAHPNFRAVSPRRGSGQWGRSRIAIGAWNVFQRTGCMFITKSTGSRCKRIPMHRTIWRHYVLGVTGYGIR